MRIWGGEVSPAPQGHGSLCLPIPGHALGPGMAMPHPPNSPAKRPWTLTDPDAVLVGPLPLRTRHRPPRQPQDPFGHRAAQLRGLRRFWGWSCTGPPGPRLPWAAGAEDTRHPPHTRRAVLNGEKKVFHYTVSPKKPAGTPCAQPWLVAVGGWRLATGGWWRLVVVGGGWWLVIGGWWRLAVVGSWRLVAAGGWRRLVTGGWWRLVVGGWWQLAVDGSWRLAVGGPLGRSLRAVLSTKKKNLVP